jgi:hypothetical protein
MLATPKEGLHKAKRLAQTSCCAARNHFPGLPRHKRPSVWLRITLLTPHTSPADTHTRIPSADGNDTPPSCD